jgi:hypothetical protein
MEYAGQVAHADASVHYDREFVDHLAGSRRHDRGAQDRIGSLPDMNFNETVILSVCNRPIDVLHHDSEALDWNRLTPRVRNMHPDVRDLGVAESAPGSQQTARSSIGGHESVPNGNGRGGLGDVCELMLHTDVPRRVDITVGRAQEVVDLDSLIGFAVYPSLLEAKPLDVGDPSDAQDDRIGQNYILDAPFQPRLDDRGVQAGFDSITRQRQR